MSNNRITPFVKRLRVNGGTFYTFSSAVEDIGINISERKNDVAIRHFALLDIPSVYLDPNDVSVNTNRFNIIDILGAFKYEQNAPNIKDGRVLIAESFQNYALNFEANLLNQTSYNPALLKTVSERVFWKWLKESGAIRWTFDNSTNYWIEEPEVNGYQKVVKYVGLSTTGNLRTDTFGTFNETYLQVPTSHGQTNVFWEHVSDDNYYFSKIISNGAASILGRESYVKPQPDGLSLNAYYDILDSSTSISVYGGSYDLYYYDDSSALQPGWWFTDEGIINPGNNAYIIDSSNYIVGDYNTKLKYDGTPTVEFLRSKIDCLSVVNNINDLTNAYNNLYGSITELSYDDMAITYSLNDNFNFNAVLVYYDIYNKTGNLDTTTTPLAVNLLGILFLDAPVSTGEIITIPSLEKIQSTSYGFGNSYNLRINIKSDNMIDDTAAVIVDMATSAQLDDFSNIFWELHKSVEILNAQTGIINDISNQYTDIYTQYLSILNTFNNYGTGNVTGENLGSQGYGIYSSTAINNNVTTLKFKQLVEGNGIIINDTGDYLQLDVSINLIDSSTADLYQYIINLQHADASLYTMILNVSTNWYSYASNVSTNLYNYTLEIAAKNFVRSASMGSGLNFNNSTKQWDVSGGSSSGVSQLYVDTSLGQYVKCVSLGTGLLFDITSKQWYVDYSSVYSYINASLNTKTSYTYVDGSLGKFIRSASLGTTLYWNGPIFDVSTTFIKDVCLGAQFSWDSGLLVIDVSVVGGSPAAPSRSIQWNNAGVFGGDANLKWLENKTLYLLDEHLNIGIGNNNFTLGVDAFVSANIALGVGALSDISVGWYNIAIGAGALGDTSIGWYNIAIGRYAGKGIINDGNIIIGSYSMENAGDSSNNIAIGTYSLQNANQVDNNIVIGYNVLNNNGLSRQPAEVLSSNIVIGNNGLNFNTVGQRNVAVGHNVGNADVAFYKESDRFIVANSSTDKPLLYGEFDNNKFIINGSVGIGDYLPNYTDARVIRATLDVHGNMRATQMPELTATHTVVWDENTGMIRAYRGTPLDLRAYIDGSLSARDTSISYLNANKTSFNYVQENYVNNASMGAGLTFNDSTNKWEEEVPTYRIDTLGTLVPGTHDLDSYAIADYNYCLYVYVINDTAKNNLRAGTFITANKSAAGIGNIVYSETSTSSIGSTSDVVLSAVVSAGNVVIRATISGVSNWNIKLIKMQI
jgi:hypothetical protein